MPSSSRRRRSSAPDNQSGQASTTSGRGRGFSETSRSPAPAEPERGGLLGWADRAGDWVGERWDAATETVGGWVDDTKQLVGDVADVVRETDIGFDQGRLEVSTDLDEVADLLPDRLAAQFQLDREASDNRVSVAFDREQGTITLRADHLALSALNLGGVAAGATSAENVEIVLRDPDGLGLDGLTDLEQYDIEVRVGSTDVTDVAVKDAEGRTTTGIDDVALDGLTFTGTRDAEGGMAAALGIDRAVATGLSGDTSADRLAVSGLAATSSADGERGTVSIDEVAADQLMSSKGRGSARLSGLEAQIANTGGGLPFLDDRADHLRADVDLRAGTLTDVDTEVADVGYLDLLDAGVDWDQDAGTLQAQLGSVGVEGFRGPVDVDRGQLGGVSVESGGGVLDASVADADLHGLGLKSGVDVGRVRAGDLAVSVDESGVRASSDSVRADGVAAGDMALQTATGRGVAFSQSGDQLRLQADGVDARGFAHGSAAVDGAQVGGADVTVGPDGIVAQAGSVSGQGVQAGSFQAGMVDANAVAFARDRRSGDLTASSSGVSASGVVVGDDVSIGSAQTGAVDVQLQDGALGVQTDSVRASGVDTKAVQTDAAALDDVSFTLDSGRGTASVGQLQAQGVDAKAVSSSDVGVTDASVRFGRGEGVGIRAGSLTAADLVSDEASADSAEVHGIAVDVGRGRTQVGVDSLAAEGIQTEHALADAARLDGVRVDVGGGRGEVGVDGLSATGIRSELGSVGQISATGSDVRFGDGLSVSTESLEASDVAVHRAGGTNSAGPSADTSQASGSGSDSGLDVASLVRSGSALVDDVDLRARTTLNERELGSGFASARVRDGTEVDGRVVVEDGEITSDTRVDLSRSIDGPLWLTGRGAYVTDDGRAMADIGGFFDQNAGKHANKALGVEGKELADVATYGAAIADGMESRAGQTNAGQSTSSTSSDGPQQDPLLRPGSLDVEGTVGLRSGTLDAGIAQAQLDSSVAGSNTVAIDVDGQSVQADLARLDLAAVAVATGDTRLSIADLDLEAARLLLDQHDGDLDATLEHIRVEQLRFESGGR